MSRTFNGTTGQVVVSPGSALNVVHTFGTAACLFRRTGIGGAWQGLINSDPNSASAWGMSIELSDVNTIWFGVGSAGQSTSTTGIVSDVWYLAVCTKATGTVLPRLHLFDYSNLTWTHADFASTAANGSDSAPARINFGSFTNVFDFFPGDIAAAGIFLQWVPTDSEIEAMGLHVSRTGWLAGAAKSTGAGVWFFDQSDTAIPVLDLTGSGANQVSTTGTTVSTVSVPILGYGSIPILGEAPSAGAPTTNANATTAEGASTALNPTKSISTNAATPSAISVAQQPSARVSPNAGNALAGSVANAFSVIVTPTVQTAVGASTALQGSAAISPALGTATAVGEALGASPAVTPGAATAQAASSALDAQTSVSSNTGTSEASLNAFNVNTSISATAGTAVAISEAFEFQWATVGEANALAETAEAIAEALNAGVIVHSVASHSLALSIAYEGRVNLDESPDTGTGISTAFNPSTTIAPGAGSAELLATAFNAGVQIFAFAGVAESEALAIGPGNEITAALETATAIAIAYDAVFLLGEIPKITGRIKLSVKDGVTRATVIGSATAADVRNRRTTGDVQ